MCQRQVGISWGLGWLSVGNHNVHIIVIQRYGRYHTAAVFDWTRWFAFGFGVDIIGLSMPMSTLVFLICLWSTQIKFGQEDIEWTSNYDCVFVNFVCVCVRMWQLSYFLYYLFIYLLCIYTDIEVYVSVYICVCLSWTKIYNNYL